MADLATAADVAARLGRELTVEETDAADAAIATVTGLIAEAVNKPTSWADTLSPAPETLKALCVEKAIGIIANPENLASTAETLGAFSDSRTFPRAADIGIFLSADERRRVRRAVFGTLVGSPQVPSTADDIWPECS